MRSMMIGAAALLGLGLTAPALAAEGGVPHLEWSFSGAFGTYDRAALQRGFQVYKEVCSACHSMKYLSYRDLRDIGFSEAEVKAIAAQYEVATIDENGDPATRKAEPSDRFHSPFPNDEAARAANGGALPPDLSLMAKARHAGPDYIVALLSGYHEPPPGFVVAEGKSYNAVFAGNNIGMPKPISDDQVTYADGTKATLAQEAHDVATFLMWAAEPKLEERKRIGVKVMGFLGLLSIFTYLSYRRVRRKVQGH
ncbi:cytochrome c1 [Zavarzinia sp.]|uniref:cytochrome c1 n=1 Tax=Zavarzinia sp. TaxID=2027920 RepID=UPI003564423E